MVSIGINATASLSADPIFVFRAEFFTKLCSCFARMSLLLMCAVVIVLFLFLLSQGHHSRHKGVLSSHLHNLIATAARLASCRSSVAALCRNAILGMRCPSSRGLPPHEDFIFGPPLL